MNPFFSIILATFNRENIISRAINSVLNQSFTDWELIIVDDCSNDNTIELIEPFLTDKRISYLVQKHNKGVSATRNNGISNSRGKYITFIDSDDQYKKNHLMERYKILKDRNIDLLHGGVEIVGNSKVPDKHDTNKLIELSECVIGGTFFINSAIKNEIKLFDETVKYSEDSHLFEKFLENKLIVEKVGIPTYIYYRDTVDSICNTVK